MFLLKGQDGYISPIVSVMHFTLIKYEKYAVCFMMHSKLVAGEGGNYVL